MAPPTAHPNSPSLPSPPPSPPPPPRTLTPLSPLEWQQHPQQNHQKTDQWNCPQSPEKGFQVPPPPPPPLTPSRSCTQDHLSRSKSNRKQLPPPPPASVAPLAAATVATTSPDQSDMGLEESNNSTALLFSPTFRKDRNLDGNVVKSIFSNRFWRGESRDNSDNSHQDNESWMAGLSGILGNWDGGIYDRSNTIVDEQDDESKNDCDGLFRSIRDVSNDDDAKTASHLLDNVPINLHTLESSLQDVSFFPSPIRKSPSQDVSSHTIILDSSSSPLFSPSEFENETRRQSRLGLRSGRETTSSISGESSLLFDYSNSELLEGEERSLEMSLHNQSENQSSAGNPQDWRPVGIADQKMLNVSKSAESLSTSNYSDSGSRHHLSDIGQKDREMLSFSKSTDSSPASGNPHSEFLNKNELTADVLLKNRSKIHAEILDGIKRSATNRQYLRRLLSLGTSQKPIFSKTAELPSESEYSSPALLPRDDHSADMSHRSQLELQIDSVAGSQSVFKNTQLEHIIRKKSNFSTTASSSSASNHPDMAVSDGDERSARAPHRNRSELQYRSVAGNQSSVKNLHDQDQLGLKARKKPNFSITAGSSLESDYPARVLPDMNKRSGGTSLRNQSDVHDEVLGGKQTNLENLHLMQLESLRNLLGLFMKMVGTPLRFLAIVFAGFLVLLVVCRFHLQYLIWIGKLQLVNGHVIVVL